MPTAVTPRWRRSGRWSLPLLEEALVLEGGEDRLHRAVADVVLLADAGVLERGKRLLRAASPLAAASAGLGRDLARGLGLVADGGGLARFRGLRLGRRCGLARGGRGLGLGRACAGDDALHIRGDLGRLGTLIDGLGDLGECLERR